MSEERVKPREDTEIEFTDKAKFNVPGSRTTVHRVHAAKLIKQGKAILAKDADTEKATKEAGKK